MLVPNFRLKIKDLSKKLDTSQLFTRLACFFLGEETAGMDGGVEWEFFMKEKDILRGNETVDRGFHSGQFLSVTDQTEELSEEEQEERRKLAKAMGGGNEPSWWLRRSLGGGKQGRV